MPWNSYEKAVAWIRRSAAPPANDEPQSLAPALPPGLQEKDLLQECLDGISVELSRLTAQVHDLTSLAECAARMALNNASQVNQGISNADNAVTAIEVLARKISDFERHFPGDGGELNSLQAGAMNAARLSFHTTVQMVSARSSAKRLSESLQGIVRLAKESQEFAADLQDRIEGGAVGRCLDEAVAKIQCLG